MAKPPPTKFVIPEADKMRAEVGASPNRLAGASGCSLATTQAVLAGKPRTRNVCERIINGLKALSHRTASYGHIVQKHSAEHDKELHPSAVSDVSAS